LRVTIEPSSYDPEVKAKPRRLGKGLFAWVGPVLSYPEEEVVSVAGLDVAVQYFGIRSMYTENAVSCVFMDFEEVARSFGSREAFILQVDIDDASPPEFDAKLGEAVTDAVTESVAEGVATPVMVAVPVVVAVVLLLLPVVAPIAVAAAVAVVCGSRGGPSLRLAGCVAGRRGRGPGRRAVAAAGDDLLADRVEFGAEVLDVGGGEVSDRVGVRLL
jgi:hypothetical protein